MNNSLLEHGNSPKRFGSVRAIGRGVKPTQRLDSIGQRLDDADANNIRQDLSQNERREPALGRRVNLVENQDLAILEP